MLRLQVYFSTVVSTTDWCVWKRIQELHYFVSTTLSLVGSIFPRPAKYPKFMSLISSVADESIQKQLPAVLIIPNNQLQIFDRPIGQGTDSCQPLATVDMHCYI